MTHVVFVAIQTQPGLAGDVCERLRGERYVHNACPVHNGPYDVVLLVEVPDIADYHVLALEVLPNIVGIDDYESFIAAGV